MEMDISSPPNDVINCSETADIDLDAWVPAPGLKCQNARMVSEAPVVEGYENFKMVLCDDLQDKTCERDMEILCPSGFHLCTHLELGTLNDNWEEKFNISGRQSNGRPLGEIYCRGDSGNAGHFTLGYGTGGNTDLSFDTKKNNWFGSSRPSCNAYDNGSTDCNEKDAKALCCSQNPKCGNGVVEAPMEECDDGNDNNG